MADEQTLAIPSPDTLERAEEYLAAMMHDEARLAEEQASLERWSDRLKQRSAFLKQRREELRSAMVRLGIKTVWAPGFTASITKGRTKKVVLDEAKAIAVCKAFYPKAIKVTMSLDKAELDCAVDTLPKHFEGIVEEQTGEPGLSIRRKEEK